MVTSSIKIALGILLLVCLFRMPYGYYQLVRFLAFVGFAILAYFCVKQNWRGGMIIYFVLALLFQPFIKVAFGRMIWNVVDVVVAVWLVVSLLQDRSKTNKV